LKVLGYFFGYIGGIFFIMYSLWGVLFGLAVDKIYFSSTIIASLLELFIGILIIIVLIKSNLRRKIHLHSIIVLSILDLLIIFCLPNCMYFFRTFCHNIVLWDYPPNTNNYKEFILYYLNTGAYSDCTISCFTLVSASIVCLSITKIKS
jgi:hypothetical protein